MLLFMGRVWFLDLRERLVSKSKSPCNVWILQGLCRSLQLVQVGDSTLIEALKIRNGGLPLAEINLVEKRLVSWLELTAVDWAWALAHFYNFFKLILGAFVIGSQAHGHGPLGWAPGIGTLIKDSLGVELLLFAAVHVLDVIFSGLQSDLCIVFPSFGFFGAAI